MGDEGSGRLHVTAGLLAQVLCLPKGVVVEDVRTVPDGLGTFELRVRGPGLPTGTPGTDVPQVEVIYERVVVKARFEVCGG